jgi:DNA-binding phage protein
MGEESSEVNGFKSRLEGLVTKSGGLVEFSKSIGIDSSTVFRWIIGDTRPQFESLRKMADKGINLNWLTTGNGEEKIPNQNEGE